MTKLPLTITYRPISVGKLRLWINMQLSMSQLQALGMSHVCCGNTVSYVKSVVLYIYIYIYIYIFQPLFNWLTKYVVPSLWSKLIVTVTCIIINWANHYNCYNIIFMLVLCQVSQRKTQMKLKEYLLTPISICCCWHLWWLLFM